MFTGYQVLGIAIVLGASGVKWGYGIKTNFFSKKIKLPKIDSKV